MTSGLPINLGPASNDEYAPLPLDPVTAEAVRQARAACDEDAKPKTYAPLVTEKDEESVRRAGTLLALADDIQARCPRKETISVDCHVGKDDVVVKVRALAGWRPRAIAKRF